jgi:predicted NBD/HSP70 family sugar kinase
MPFELWNWADAAGAPRDVMEHWRNRDIRADIQAQLGFPVYLQNDATSACGAELVFGKGGTPRDFIYFYIGAFAGGGIVLNGGLYSGPTGNAGALGSMPVPGTGGAPRQLIDIASIAMLERALNATGREASFLWTSPHDWGEIGPELDAWILSAANGLAYAIVSASSVIDFQAAVIDGWMPASVRARLVAAVGDALSRIDAEGLALPPVREGTVGIHARALGGASLPLSDRFLVGATAVIGS